MRTGKYVKIKEKNNRKKGDFMLKKYKTILAQAEAEIMEKKSRFIATVRPVKTEEEAKAFIEEMKKKYQLIDMDGTGMRRIMCLHIRLGRETNCSVSVTTANRRGRQGCLY